MQRGLQQLVHAMSLCRRRWSKPLRWKTHLLWSCNQHLSRYENSVRYDIWGVSDEESNGHNAEWDDEAIQNGGTTSPSTSTFAIRVQFLQNPLWCLAKNKLCNRGKKFPVTYCDITAGGRSKYTNLTVGWYRFTGAAGTKLPTAPALVGGPPKSGKEVCGTHGVAFILSGGNPTIQDGIVTRDVCFEWGSNSCRKKTTVGVAACRDIHGDYFVYQLQPVTGCHFAYCAID